MKKKLKLLFIGFLFIFLIACTSGSNQNSEREYHRGTEGINFEIHGLLEKMYEGTPFQIIVQLFNKGAYDVAEGYVVVTVEKDYMDIDGEQLHQFVLAGKSLFNPAGDFSLETFDIKTKQIDKTSQYHNSLVTVTACYKYMTDVITEVCIDPHFYDLVEAQKACEVKDLSLGDQGAPVAITNVEIKMLPNGENYVRPQFIIHIRNNGNGNVINYKADEGIKKICTEETLNYQNWNLIELSEIAFNNKEYQFSVNNKGKNNIECLPNPKDKLLRLKDNEAIIRCTVEGVGISKKEAAYLTQLFIKLEYGYTLSKSQEINIEKQLTY